jgi:hypothetical protein
MTFPQSFVTGNDSIDFTWPSDLQMDRSSLPAVKFGRFKPFFIWFPWQIIQVIFSQNFITVPGTVCTNSSIVVSVKSRNCKNVGACHKI